MIRHLAVCSLIGLAVLMVGCSTPKQWVLISVRDALTRLPIEEPYVTITPDGGMFANPSEQTRVKANDFGVARVELATGGSNYVVTVDAPEYDLQRFDLPALDSFFPSGKWLKGRTIRQYVLRPDNTVELMVTVEPK